MLEKTYMVMCDICGKMEPANKKLGQYNEEFVEAPSNWYVGANKNVHICPDCGQLLRSSGRLKLENE